MLGVTCCEVVCVSVAEEQLSPLTGVHNHWPPYEQAKVWGEEGRREERRDEGRGEGKGKDG